MIWTEFFIRIWCKIKNSLHAIYVLYQFTTVSQLIVIQCREEITHESPLANHSTGYNNVMMSTIIPIVLEANAVKNEKFKTRRYQQSDG